MMFNSSFVYTCFEATSMFKSAHVSPVHHSAPGATRLYFFQAELPYHSDLTLQSGCPKGSMRNKRPKFEHASFFRGKDTHIMMIYTYIYIYIYTFVVIYTYVNL